MNVRNTSNEKNLLMNGKINEGMIMKQDLNVQQKLNKNFAQGNEKLNEQQKLTQKYYLDLYYKEKFNNSKNENMQNIGQIEQIKQKLNFDKDMDEQQFVKFVDYYKQFQNNNYPLLSQLISSQEKEKLIQIEIENQKVNQQIINQEEKQIKESNDQFVNKSSSSEDSDRGMQLMLNQIKQEVLQLKIQKGLIPNNSNLVNPVVNKESINNQLSSPIQSHSDQKQSNINIIQFPTQYQNAPQLINQQQIFDQYQIAQPNQIFSNNETNNLMSQYQDQIQNEFSPDSLQIQSSQEKHPLKKIQQLSQSKNQNVANKIDIDKYEQIVSQAQNENNQNEDMKIEKKNWVNKIVNNNEEQKAQQKQVEEEKNEKRRIQTSPLTRQLSQKDSNHISSIQGIFLQKNKSNNLFCNLQKDIDQEEKDFLYLNIPPANKSDIEETSERNEPINQNQQRIFQDSPLSSKKQLDGHSQSNTPQSKSKTSSDDLNILPRLQNNIHMQQQDQRIQQNHIEETKIDLNTRQRSFSNLASINQLHNNQFDEQIEDIAVFNQEQYIVQNQVTKKEQLQFKSYKQKNTLVDERINQQIVENQGQIVQMNNLQRRNDDLFEQNRIRERKQMADNILKQSPNKDKTIDILKDNSELRNSESGRSIQNSQKTCNNSSQKLSNDISQQMVDQKLSSVKKIQLINQSNQKSIRLDDIILNDQLSHQNIINQQLVFNNEIFFSMLENKLQNQWTKQQKSITHDQNMQTDPDVSTQMNVKLTSAKEIQTDVQKVNKIQLSPFETYDLLFVKDLVNNLNKDNEILFDNTSDLKKAFLFLHQEHKKLQFKYQKEQRNSCFVDLYKERLEEITNERDKALNIGMKLRDKIEIMTDIMKTAVEQQQLQQAEQDQTIQQLMEENKQLRSVLQIHRDIQSDDVYISSEQRQKKEFLDSSQELDDKNEMDKNTSIENEIENGLMQYEQELRRNQDDYLIFLKEEQDRQFNQEIDEHKEILSGIYDQKLIQKTQEIEQQLLDSLTKQITEQITQNIQKEMSEHLRDQLREEVKQEIRSQLIEEVTQQVQEQFQSNMQNHSNQTSPQKQPSLQYEELKEDKSDKLSQDEKTKDINISQNEGNEQIITKVEQNDQIQINQLNDSSESDQPYQTLSYDTFKNLQKDDKSDIDFKMMFEDQPLSQEEQELFFQLQQREEGFKDNNQFQEEQKTQEQFDSNDNDQTQKIIFQEFTQEKRNHNQSQGFQGQHVFNNYFSSTQISQDQLSNEQFQGQSRGSQRLESIFHYDSSNFNQVPLHPLVNNQVNSYSNNFKSIQGFQGQSSNPSQFNNQLEPSQQIEQLQNNENLNDEIFNNNEGNFEELNQQFNDDYSDFLQGLQETDQRRYSFQSMQNNEPFEIANQIEENQDNNLDQLNDNQQEYNYSLTRCGESIDFLGDQLEKDLFNNQDNIQSPISFLMDDGETLSDIFKLKQSNNSSPKQQSPFKSQQRYFPQNMLDSTNGIRSMLVQIKKLNKENNENTEEESQEREEYKEEEYDYFLDAQQDENMLNNNGYHIIDQAELDQSESKDKDSKSQMNKNNGCLNSEYDEDIENIEDEELREYRYRNMLEDLKESIQSEDDEAKRKNQS